MNKVCAVVVTHDRNELLLRNINSILSQTVEADVLVYDNASAEDAGAYLAAKGLDLCRTRIGEDVAACFYEHRLVLVRDDENSGGAGGFCRGIAYAYDSGHEYIWLMDDDGYCLDNRTLERLLSHMEPGLILNSLVVCDPSDAAEDVRFSFSLLGERSLGALIDKGLVKKGDELIRDAVSTFNSTLFSRDLVMCIGTVDPKFFIYGDDWDYLERAKAVGYKTHTVIDSRYFHPDSGMGDFRVFGRLIDLRVMTDENTFYYERNSAWIMKHYRSEKQAWLHVFKTLAKCLFYRKRRFARTRAALIGLLDGWHDRMDTTL